MYRYLGLLCSIFIILSFSIICMYGASSSIALKLGLPTTYFISKHIFNVVICVLTIILFSNINPSILFEYSIYIYIFILFLLVLVIVPSIGIELNGARRWLSISYFYFQPSELFKFAIVLFLSDKVGKYFERGEIEYSFFLKQSFIVFLSVLLILFETDLSNSLVIIVASINFLFICGLRFNHILVMIAIFIFGLVIVSFIKFNYIIDRINIYLNMLSGVDIPYQVNQAYKAIYFSSYLGGSLSYSSFIAKVPELHTDFYFIAMICDIGIFGCIFLICIYVYTYIYIYILASNIYVIDYRMACFLYFTLLILGWQFIFSISGVLGIFPIAGITTPMLSYGGSSMIVNGCFVGFILSIHRYYS